MKKHKVQNKKHEKYVFYEFNKKHKSMKKT